MSLSADKIYKLLPAVHRRRDEELGGPLRALVGVIAEQTLILEDDLAQRYEDLFIETCADWAVPYIGDLLDVRELHEIDSVTSSRRAEVANTIAYRRRKGTATMLEQLARDVTGWPSRAVEFFELLATTQLMNHIRPEKGGTVDLRQWEALENIGSAFEQTAHTVDVRRMPTAGGRFNIANVALFLWRLEAFPLTRVEPYQIDGQRFMFSPLGNNTQLFTHAVVERSITHLAERSNVPAAISRRVLHQYLDHYYGQDLSLVLWRGDVPIPIEDIRVCNLSDDEAGEWAIAAESNAVGIDPVLGRIAFADVPTEKISVSYFYGFSAAMGGGEYARTPINVNPPVPTVTVPVNQPAIQEALNALADGGSLEITTNDTFTERLNIQLNSEKTLSIRSSSGRRPCIELLDELLIEGQGAAITLDGLLISGAPVRVAEGVREVRLRHCTLVPGYQFNHEGAPSSPGAPALIVDSAETKIIIEHCILGPMHIEENALVALSDSVIDATDSTLPVYTGHLGEGFGAPLTIDRCTLIGRVQTRILNASNAIFYAHSQEPTEQLAVHVERLQEGCVRFSYVPLAARVPRRYRCQPNSETPNVQPFFTSLKYGQEAYCQLVVNGSVEISQGADDESEMGVFHDLFQPQRIANLHLRLDEYLRFGLESGEFFET